LLLLIQQQQQNNNNNYYYYYMYYHNYRVNGVAKLVAVDDSIDLCAAGRSLYGDRESASWVAFHYQSLRLATYYHTSSATLDDRPGTTNWQSKAS